MPQLNPEFFVSQLFWLVVTFSFLLVFLWRISLPRIGSVLYKRERKINEDLATAKKLQAEAENIQSSIENQIRKARSDASEMLKTASGSFADKTGKEIGKLEKELELKINNSADNIENVKQESLSQLETQILDITKLTLSKIVKFKVSNEEIKSAINSLRKPLN